MADLQKEETLIKTLKEAAAAHHEYEDGFLKGQLDTQALGWYAGFVIGRLGDFAAPTELNSWLLETRVRNKEVAAAQNVLKHLSESGRETVKFTTLPQLDFNNASAKDQLVAVLKQAASAHHEYEDGALKGKLDEQALGWYAGFVVGRLGNFATTTDLTGWLLETRVRNKEELAANNVITHLKNAVVATAKTPAL